MAVFLSGYAFERQGRPARFAPTAVEVVQQLQASGRSIEQQDLEEEAWDSFSRKLDGRSLNHANNPMAPRGTLFTRNGRELKTAGRRCLNWLADWDAASLGTLSTSLRRGTLVSCTSNSHQ